MENLLTVAFEAHNAERNHHRHYVVTVGRDLLDDWTVSIRYGRSGNKGQEKRFSSSMPDQMRSLILKRLRSRLSAPKRLGCAYRLVMFDAAPGFDAMLWIPEYLIIKFL